MPEMTFCFLGIYSSSWTRLVLTPSPSPRKIPIVSRTMFRAQLRETKDLSAAVVDPARRVRGSKFQVPGDKCFTPVTQPPLPMTSRLLTLERHFAILIVFSEHRHLGEDETAVALLPLSCPENSCKNDKLAVDQLIQTSNSLYTFPYIVPWTRRAIFIFFGDKTA